jgi:predicted GH43/DUF377 family glycosyl hydrolase
MNDDELFKRNSSNPLFTATDMPFPCKAVCNPAACLVDGEAVSLLRVIDLDEYSHLVVARSQDGLAEWRIQAPPLLSPGPEAAWYETLGCEDARITYLSERGEYVIAYVGASHQGAGV